MGSPLEDRSFKAVGDRGRDAPIVPVTLHASLPPDALDGREPPPTEDEILAAPKVCDHPTLTMITGPQAGSVFRLEKTTTLVGRASDCAILVDNPGVSRHHASILQTAPNAFAI